MKQKKNNIVIIGGGIVGSLLGLILGLNGLKVTIIDRQKKATLYSNSYNPKSYALNQGSQSLLMVSGIWDIIKKNSQPISKIQLQQGSSNSSIQPFEINFKNDINNDCIFYMVEEVYLRKAILSKISSCSNIKYLNSRYVVDQKIKNYYAKIILDDGQMIYSDLIVGSDGYPSTSAKWANIKHSKYNYCQSSVVGIFRHEIPHYDEAFQIFLPSGPLAILPLTGNRSSFVWTMESNEANRKFNLSNQSFLKELNEIFKNKRGSLQLDNQKYIFPISLAISKKIVEEKFVLIGDSAHKIHPIAGQGLNLGIRDVAALSEILILARRLGEDIGSKYVLDRYARWRNIDVLTITFFTDSINKIFSNDNFLLQFTRGLGFRILDNSDTIKKYLIKEASGLVGDIPKLLKGENI